MKLAKQILLAFVAKDASAASIGRDSQPNSPVVSRRSSRVSERRDSVSIDVDLADDIAVVRSSSVRAALLSKDLTADDQDEGLGASPDSDIDINKNDDDVFEDTGDEMTENDILELEDFREIIRSDVEELGGDDELKSFIESLDDNDWEDFFREFFETIDELGEMENVDFENMSDEKFEEILLSLDNDELPNDQDMTIL